MVQRFVTRSKRRGRSIESVPAAVAAIVVLVAAGCVGVTRPATPDARSASSVAPAASSAGSALSAPSTAPSPTLPATGVSPSPATSEATPVAGAAQVENLTEPFDRDTFHASTTVDNAWFPLVPGTRWTFQGKANDGPDRVSRKVVITVTDLVKVIDGVASVVTYDLDYTAGDLEEQELAFYAQDDAGTVWLMGEYPEEVEEGKIVKVPAWIAGNQDSKAGIFMKPEPEPFAPSYSEGWGPAVGWTDRAKVFETGSTTCVVAGCYTDVLVIDEFNRDEPDAHQLKYYARGVGGVRVGWAGAKEDEQEVLGLVKVERLSPDALAKARAAALSQDARAAEKRPDVFDGVPPAVPASGG